MIEPHYVRITHPLVVKRILWATRRASLMTCRIFRLDFVEFGLGWIVIEWVMMISPRMIVIVISVRSSLVR